MNTEPQSQLAFLQQQIEEEQGRIRELEEYQTLLESRNREKIERLVEQCKLNQSEPSEQYSERIRGYEEYMREEFGLGSEAGVSGSERELEELDPVHSYRYSQRGEGRKEDAKIRYVSVKNPVEPVKLNVNFEHQLEQIKHRAQQQARLQFNKTKQQQKERQLQRQRQKSLSGKITYQSTLNSSLLDLSLQYSKRLQPNYPAITVKNIIRKGIKEINSQRHLLNQYKAMLLR